MSILPTSRPGEVTKALIDDGRLRKLTFTGSTGVGKALVAQSADKLLRTSMELGGNAPFVVFDDADVDAAVEGAMLAKMRNGGEACTAANRLHVANAVIEEFTDKFVKRMGEITLGNGLDPSSKLGPLVNTKQLAKVQELVDDAVDKGATVALGGQAPAARATSTRPPFSPTFPPTPASSPKRCSGRSPRSSASTPRKRASRRPTTPSTVWRPTSTPSRWTGRCGWPRPWSRAWSASTVASSPIRQMPSGGVKESGFGREGGYEGIEEYLDTKYIALTK